MIDPYFAKTIFEGKKKTSTILDFQKCRISRNFSFYFSLQMALLTRKCLLCLILAMSLVSSCLATADAASDSKASSKNSVPPLKRLRSRAGQAIQSEVSYANYYPLPAHQYPTPALVSPGIAYPSFHQPSIYGNYYPAPAPPAYHNPHQAPVTTPPYEALASVAEKYYPTFNELIPYMQSPGNIASRVWQKIPPVRQIADRTLNAITSVIGITVIAPALILTLILFAAFVAILNLFPAVSAFGRRDIGHQLFGLNDLNEVFHFDRFLPFQQSRALASLAARVGSVLDTYMDVFKSDTCLERYSCEAGKMTSWIDKFTEPLIL